MKTILEYWDNSSLKYSRTPPIQTLTELGCGLNTKKLVIQNNKNPFIRSCINTN